MMEFGKQLEMNLPERTLTPFEIEQKNALEFLGRPTVVEDLKNIQRQFEWANSEKSANDRMISLNSDLGFEFVTGYSKNTLGKVGKENYPYRLHFNTPATIRQKYGIPMKQAA